MLILRFLFFIVIFTNVKAGALLNLPFPPTGIDLIIQATLTDLSTQDQWQIEEKIAWSDTVRGAIRVESSTKNIEIFYNENNDENRLLIYDNQCVLSEFLNNKWSSLLPNTDKPLVNLVLMMGPSIIHRLQNSDYVWLDGGQAKIRGYDLKKYKTNIDNALDVTIYARDADDIRRANPVRIEFEGFVPGSLTRSTNEHLILDIYFEEQAPRDFDKEVSPKPGIGCPRYLEVNKEFPGIQDSNLHALIYDTVKADDTSAFKPGSTMEIYMDIVNHLIRITSSSQGYLDEGLYDYNLMTAYLMGENFICAQTPMDLNFVGIYENQFNANDFFWMNGHYRYIGEMFDPFRSGIISSVWEATAYNMEFEGKSYDKAVTTQYFTKKFDRTGSIQNSTFIPIGITRNLYKKTATNGYINVGVLRRDIFDYSSATSVESYGDLFQLDDCYDKPEDRKTIQFSVRPTNLQESQLEESLTVAQQHINKLKNYILNLISSNIIISPTRIVHIDMDSETDRLMVRVEFVREPKVSTLFKSQYHTVKIDDTLSTQSIKKFTDQEECLEALVMKNPDAKYYVYCETGICAPLEDVSKLQHENGGKACFSFDRGIADENYILQIPLDKIHDALLEKLSSFHTFDIQTGSQTYTYMIDDIIETVQSVEAETYKALYTSAASGMKLNSAKSEVQSYTASISDFGDCYRLCSDSEELPCETFAFCENGKNIACLTTSTLLHPENLTDKSDWVEVDQNCNVYTPNYLPSFHKIPNKKFTDISDTPLAVYSAEECANKCVSSEECKSFQICNDDSLCSFSGLTTAKNTESSSRCNVYSPKAIFRFHLTGKETINDVETVELNIGIDECAALCFHWTDDSEKCKSFNFCPKSKSTVSMCQITKHTVGSPDVATSSSESCRNYQLNDDSLPGKLLNEKSSINTGTGAVFGIIILFLFVGLLFGGVSYLIYNKLKTINLPDSPVRDFKWSKQVDEGESSMI